MVQIVPLDSSPKVTADTGQEISFCPGNKPAHVVRATRLEARKLVPCLLHHPQGKRVQGLRASGMLGDAGRRAGTGWRKEPLAAPHTPGMEVGTTLMTPRFRNPAFHKNDQSCVLHLNIMERHVVSLS